MSQWMGDLAHDYLSGIYRAMHTSMLESHYLQADETPIDYLDPGHGSTLGKAINYALGQWPRLERCFTDGRLEIDNNLIENGIRPTKLGAKNWLFMGSEQAGQTNAIWYTLIESCRRRKLDPWRYLVWIFEELPKIKVKRDTFASYTPESYALHLRANSRAKHSA